MVICISGPMSTGKSTLIKKISQIENFCGFNKIIVVDEIIRDIFKEYSDEFNSLDELMKDRSTVLKWIKEVGKKTSDFINSQIEENNDENTLLILDRCILDHFVYALLFIIDIELSREEFFSFVSEYAKRQDNIDYYFLTKIKEQDEYELEAVRPKTWEETRNIESCLFDLFFTGIGKVLPHETEERVKFIEKTLKKRFE